MKITEEAVREFLADLNEYSAAQQHVDMVDRTAWKVADRLAHNMTMDDNDTDADTAEEVKVIRNDPQGGAEKLRRGKEAWKAGDKITHNRMLYGLSAAHMTSMDKAAQTLQKWASAYTARKNKEK